MKAAFLDRDGTIIEDKNYLSTPMEIRFSKGAIPGLRLLRERGFELFIVTNQSGVSRGYLSLNRLFEIHKELTLRLKSEGIPIRGILFCPHHPREGCTCRKPSPRLILRLIKEYPQINLEASVTVGDKETDVKMGRILGTRTVLIGENVNKSEADFVAKNLFEAVQWIVEGE